MDDICRLCCSTSFVNNNIFDEENALYLKMSLYLPIKVFKNDHLPQKVCDKCSCKVNDFYQFCNETIEVQNRLRAALLSSGIITDDTVDLTLVKENLHSPTPPTNIASCDQSTQTENEPGPVEDKTNKTDTNNIPSEVKLEPSTVKMEQENPDFETFEDSYTNFDSSEDESLINLKKKKRRTRKMKTEVTNGSVNESKKTRKKKQAKDWEMLMKALPETTFSVVKTNSKLETVKEEDSGDQDGSLDHIEVKKKIKSEPNEADIYHCCICFTQCYSRPEMLYHYKQHASEADAASGAPAAPPPPDQHPLRCTRCQKVLERGAWAEHWARHWERDRRPYRCALCEKTFRDHHQILKHGMTHKLGEEGPEEQPANKRFICDLCPEGFVYMRYLLSHRTRAHPEAATRALTLRCAQCGRQFAHLNSLRRHLRAHSGERNHLCNVCGKALSSREHLKFHIRIHTGYKPNVCKTCGKGFVKKCNLTLHERVHSGEKPHVCPHCGKAFSQRSTLVIHERYHSGARPYVCALCHRGFVAKGLLSMHLKTTCI